MWCCPCGIMTLNAVVLISKMRKGNKERKKSLIFAGKIKSKTSDTISDSTECYAGLSVRFESSAACL